MNRRLPWFAFGRTSRELKRGWRDAMSGIPTRYPLMQVHIPSVVDPTLAPPGEHVMSIWVTYEPAHLRNGSWDSVRQSVGEALLDEHGQLCTRHPRLYR